MLAYSSCSKMLLYSKIKGRGSAEGICPSPVKIFYWKKYASVVVFVYIIPSLDLHMPSEMNVRVIKAT